MDHTDVEGWTALRAAAWGGHSQVMSLFILNLLNKYIEKYFILGSGVVA